MIFDDISIDWEKINGLVPAIVQNINTYQVLMLGYMNRRALEITCQTGLVTFYSRSKQRLWKKGETSGNTLRLADISQDCDSDALLLLAEPQGPTCHKGSNSCFGDDKISFFPHKLQKIIDKRMKEDGYTANLASRGHKSIAQKVGEEGVEVALSALGEDNTEILQESADLLFHLTLLLRSKNLSINDVEKILRKRHRLKVIEKNDN